MKKLVLTLGIAVLAVSGALAQGTLQFQNQSLSSSIFTNTTALGGTRGKVNANQNIVVGLFWGTSAGSVTTLAGTETFNPAGPGVLNGNANFQLAGTQPNDTDFVQLIAWDAGFGLTASSAAASQAAGSWYGATGILPFILGPSAGPGTTIFGSSSSTGLFKSFDVTITPAPEPTTLALGGIGAAALLLFRRKK